MVVVQLILYRRVHAAGFELGEDFREVSRLGIDSQHVRAHVIDNQKATERRRMKGLKGEAGVGCVE